MLKKWSEEDEVEKYALLYFIFQGFAISVTFLRPLTIMIASLRGSKAIHKDVLDSLVQGSISKYYDVTPIGRVINRLSKDLGIIDLMLP